MCAVNVNFQAFLFQLMRERSIVSDRSQVHSKKSPDAETASCPTSLLSSDISDVLVIGAGVVGCAVARRLAMEGARVILADKEADILCGASKGNSAILHTGFDAPPGSVEQACIAAGYREFREAHKRFNLPLAKTGAMVLAWDDTQEAQIESIVSKAHANGVSDVAAIDADAARARVPSLAKHLRGAALVPGESLVDPWSTPLAYLRHALACGARFVSRCEVRGGHFDGKSWRVSTSQGDLQARWLVNCAGLYGDIVHERLFADALFCIRPRKGQFLVYDKSAARLTGMILLQAPTERTKGVVVCPTVFGNLLVGPSAEDQDSRDDASVDMKILSQLKSVGQSVLPQLRGHEITAVYAGIRPATQSADYQIHMDGNRQYLCIGGIRSTGLSAALGIARLAADKIFDCLSVPPPAESVPWPAVPAISELGERDWMVPGNGGIVCHCELVTRREIENALQGPLPAASLEGLKRRTRVTMGRCQGFYCGAELSEMTAGRLYPPIAVTG